MTRLCILTVDPAEPNYAAIWPPFFERLAEPLRAVGLDVVPAAWTGPLPEADGYAALMVWGYHREWARWLAFLDDAEGGRRLVNPAATLRWNGDKAYLLELAGRGAPIPPTLPLDHPTPEAVDAALATLGAEEGVLKPRVSGGSYQTVRVRRGEPFEGGPTGAALLQPFLPAVAREGEWSLFFFDGAFSHGLTKVAAEGDFRVQPQFGGIVTASPVPPAAMLAAEAVLAACPHPLVYARVDLIADGCGGYSLMELEAIEPHLFLQEAGNDGRAFAAAMKRAVEA